MQDFETVYGEKISSTRDNEIVDEYFIDLLKDHNFVELLKSLYYSQESADVSSIYLGCLEQGYRICDLQRAFCILVDEWYDGPVCFVAAPKNNKEEIVRAGEKSIETISRLTEEYYLHICFISKEEVIVGETNSIKIESNLFSVRSILDEVAEWTPFNIDQNDMLPMYYSDAIQDNFKFKINTNNIDTIRSYNSVSVQCLDDNSAGDFYYAIVYAADELVHILEKENCLIRIREFIAGLINLSLRNRKNKKIRFFL